MGTEVALDHMVVSDLKLLQDQLVKDANVTVAPPLGKTPSVINFPQFNRKLDPLHVSR